MTQTNPDFAATKAAAAIPAELLGAATRKIADVLEVHKDLLETFEAINHEFFCRAKKEADLASDFVEQFGSVRSIPDAATVYRDWATKWMELLAADSRQLFEHGEKIAHASRRLFTNGGNGAGSH